MTSTGLYGILEQKAYQPLDNVLPLGAGFTNWTTEYEKTASMTKVHTRLNKIVADITADMRQQTCGEEKLGRLERRVRVFKRILVETFDVHRDSSLYTPTYHLLDGMVEDYEVLARYLFLTAVQTSILMCTSSKPIRALCK